jgi:predicted Rossmann fold nucleotide-binding protein DprA/Smf involved in DNA uptake
MNVNAVKNMNADPRMVQKISRDSTMMYEQGGVNNFMAEYGGAQNYIRFAKMPESQRLVYASLLDGYTQSDQIAVATGLSEAEVNVSLNRLSKDGLVDMGNTGREKGQTIPLG